MITLANLAKALPISSKTQPLASTACNGLRWQIRSAPSSTAATLPTCIRPTSSSLPLKTCRIIIITWRITRGTNRRDRRRISCRSSRLTQRSSLLLKEVIALLWRPLRCSITKLPTTQATPEHQLTLKPNQSPKKRSLLHLALARSSKKPSKTSKLKRSGAGTLERPHCTLSQAVPSCLWASSSRRRRKTSNGGSIHLMASIKALKYFKM